MKYYELVISIVSHNQGQQVKLILDDIKHKCNYENLAVVLTLNAPEELTFSPKNYTYRLEIVVNEKFRGFGANHNRASLIFPSEYFCVLNPDVRLINDPFKKLLNCFKNASVGVVAPSVINEACALEDNVRLLPLPYVFPSRLTRKKRDYLPGEKHVEVDWAAGMFLLFDTRLFHEIKGFDEKYYLYCEDIDICSRVWLHNRKVIWQSGVTVVHEARRDSRNKAKYFVWHLASYLKMFRSSVYYKRLKQKRSR